MKFMHSLFELMLFWRVVDCSPWLTVARAMFGLAKLIIIFILLALLHFI
jgi:hypothetical protein